MSTAKIIKEKLKAVQAAVAAIEKQVGMGNVKLYPPA